MLLTIFFFEKEKEFSEIRKISYTNAVGQMTILKNHTPYVSTIEPGTIVIEHQNNSETQIEFDSLSIIKIIGNDIKIYTNCIPKFHLPSHVN